MHAIVENTGRIVEGTIETSEISELQEREGRIERAQRNAYFEIGLELKSIRDKNLYKQNYDTFEEYVKSRWEMNVSHAYRLILAAEAAAQLSPIGDKIPARETHVRALLSLAKPEERAIVWQNIIDTYDHPKVKDIEAEVLKFISNKNKNWITLEEWKAMKEEEREQAMLIKKNNLSFNKQDNESIDWAQWSWNPVTGCKHDCPYCYARDIAERFYPKDQGFEPSIIPERLWIPYEMKVPDGASNNIKLRNVFTCSMADLFGRWVPAEWIEAVLNVVRQNEQWNFLFLTKFPKRMSEFDVPSNAWMGATVDLQARVKSSEDAFEKIGSAVKWLSIEPMLEPLQFSRLELFDWIVIGGASKSSRTPDWTPNIDWVVKLHYDARIAGCAIYYKNNSGMTDSLRIKEFPWEMSHGDRVLPDSFKYLGVK